MKERPILFSGEMVRAILDGRKTQTRRILKKQPEKSTWAGLPGYRLDAKLFDNVRSSTSNYSCVAVRFSHRLEQREDSVMWVHCPYGNPGDRLWVKETHYAFGHWERTGIIYPAEIRTDENEHWRFVHYGHNVVFDAPREFMTSRSKADPSGVRWYKRNSLFMPKWAARTWLENAGVRLQRLQDISGTDAIAEGIQAFSSEGITTFRDYITGLMDRAARQSYETLWKKINGPGSWEKNDWVWVVSFNRIVL